MLNKDELLAAAVEQTSLSDFGEDDFLEPLGRLIQALNRQARLNNFGEIRARMTISAGLVNRLKIEDYVRTHPEIRRESIARPVFIVGLPRTGTTALHHMLSCDEGNRTLRFWETHHPPVRCRGPR